MARPLLFLPPLAFAAIAAGFFLGMQREDPDLLPSAREGQIVPAVILQQLGDDPPFDSEDLRSGGVKLVNYWASWCAPCRAEHPNLETLAEEGIPIYGINYKDDPQKAQAFLDELGDPFMRLAADSDGRTAIDWGVYAMPESFVVDGDGQIVLHFRGPITQRSLEARIRPAIEAAAE